MRHAIVDQVAAQQATLRPLPEPIPAQQALAERASERIAKEASYSRGRAVLAWASTHGVADEPCFVALKAAMDRNDYIFWPLVECWASCSACVEVA